MSVTFLFLLLSALNTAAGRQPPAGWHEKTTPHFTIYHESDWAPDSISLELERLYGKLRLTVSMFAPWMVRERTKIYIYSDHDSYLNGEFRPPKWSKGLAYSAARTVVVYDMGDMVKLRATAAHELSHLYFESFYGEHLSYPPQWLNEGLAVMMEDISYRGEGPWAEALKYYPEEKIIHVGDFVRTGVDGLDSSEQVGYWYLEAFGVVSYLFRPNKRLQFKNFCLLLRKGEKLEPALWKVYRIRDLSDLDREWRAWLKSYGEERNNGSGGGFSSASYEPEPLKLPAYGGKSRPFRR